jgi:hypothetical protein
MQKFDKWRVWRHIINIEVKQSDRTWSHRMGLRTKNKINLRDMEMLFIYYDHSSFARNLQSCLYVKNGIKHPSQSYNFTLSIYTINFANIHQLAETRVLLVLYNRLGDVLTSGPSTFHHNVS